MSGVAYGYCRASTGRQDITFDVQQQAIEKYFKGTLEPKGFTWGGFFEDKAVSGAVPFTERPEGLRLWVLLQPGDSLVWMKMDRASRSTADGARLIEMLCAKKIAVHSLDLGMDMTSPTGQFMASLLVSMGQLERAWISSRTKDAFAAMRAKGIPMATSVPCGYKKGGPKKHPELIPDTAERLLMDDVHAKFVAGWAIEKISNAVFFAGHRRTTKGSYKPDWMVYGLVSRALGYPVMFNYQEYLRISQQHRDILGGRGRSVVLKKLSLAESGQFPGVSS